MKNNDCLHILTEPMPRPPDGKEAELEERALLERFRQLNAQNRRQLMELAEQLASLPWFTE